MPERCLTSPEERAATGRLHPARRPSRVGKWRALVLILVHVGIALHIAHWLETGRTLSPLEPSEAMEFSKHGIVNAGLILFALATASTLVLGRWFCGWTCHIVAVQDLCAWLLKKARLRPRHVHLGLLATVPWLAFVYMFVSPLVGRALAGEGLGEIRVDPYKDDFLATFPDFLHTTQGLLVTLLTLAVCGFAIVWLLGSKGFCAYACPYGGIFGVADQLAPGRIRVTDACDSCGHCTAACTSNVNVSQEVRAHGMVVDPGCMKCLDCVSVCPKDALYVGFGAPALLARAPTPRAPAAPAPARGGPAQLALLAAFVVAALSVFHAYNGAWSAYLNAPPWELIGVLSVGCVAVALVFRGKARRHREYSLGEETLLAGAFLAAMLAFRGLHGWVPFLFALGLSAIAAYLLVQGVRLVRRSDLALQRVTLKRGGRWTAAGAAAGVLLALGALGWARAGLEQRAIAADAGVRAAAELAEAQRFERLRERYNDGVRAAEAGRFAEAVAAFQEVVDADPDAQEARENLAGMLCAVGRLEEGAAEYERALERRPDDPETHALAARAYVGLRRPQAALAHLQTAVRLAPERRDLRLFLADLLEATGDAAGAAAQRQAAGGG